MAPIALVIPDVAQQDPLEQLQSVITMHESSLAAMETESAHLGTQLGDSSGLAAKLKIRISEGDGSAADLLDKLEREQQDISRRHEGLRLRCATLQSELAPLVRRAAELAQERDREKQDQAVKEIAVRKDELIDDIVEHWRRSCEAAYELMTMLDGGMSRQTPLDEEHRREIFAMNTSVGERLQQAALVHANHQNQFLFARSEVFTWLRIIPAKRKAALKHIG